jgi:hypothetical protein
MLGAHCHAVDERDNALSGFEGSFEDDGGLAVPARNPPKAISPWLVGE